MYIRSQKLSTITRLKSAQNRNTGSDFRFHTLIAPLAKVPRGYTLLLVAGSSLLQVEGSGRVVNAKTVEQVGACDHQVGHTIGVAR